MSNKNRNTQQAQQRPAAQQTSTQQEQNPEGQQQQGQEDQAQQNGASQDTGTEQQSNDQAAGDQGEQKEAVAQPPVQPPVQEKPVAAPAVTTKQEGFAPVLKVQLDLNNYAEAMDKKKSIVPEEGGRWQYSLFSTLKEVLNAKDQETFNKEWNTALMFFHQQKDGIFNENFLFRFPEQWPGSSNEYTTCRRILYVMIQTANAKTRKAELKHINLELVVEGLNPAQRTKFLNFYEA